MGLAAHLLNRMTIWRATAPAPEGPWTAAPEPVLEPGRPGAWDSQLVEHPNVLKTEGGYLMFYNGSSAAVRGSSFVGLATSADGIQWTKYDDPATTEARYAGSDPVFGPGPAGDWDSRTVWQPRVVQTTDGCSWPTAALLKATVSRPWGWLSARTAFTGSATQPIPSWPPRTSLAPR
ncbi:MAG: hypothetical protein L0332_14195 [Chloroflexi bacterium]|nr:hypothetical protein [Chloroflexota bacterium]MCI0579331.1 hypothetical protein [Chloroflexota bacterium]MCI0644974.1 hypothetical protein [Chloroflexota bacterium]MCI0727853.1 hypothetical protein [Chloroflexota bacterium]